MSRRSPIAIRIEEQLREIEDELKMLETVQKRFRDVLGQVPAKPKKKAAIESGTGKVD